MPRTTLAIDTSLLREIRKLAHTQNRSMQDVVNDLLRRSLKNERQAPRRRLSLPTFEMGAPLVDLADRHALERAMEEP